MVKKPKKQNKRTKKMFYYNYDKGEDILECHFGEQTKYSMELFNGDLILDFNKKDEVIGFEIMDFLKKIHARQKELRKELIRRIHKK